MSDRTARLHALQQALKERILILDGGMGTMIPVSYTHLTLPTNREV